MRTWCTQPQIDLVLFPAQRPDPQRRHPRLPPQRVQLIQGHAHKTITPYRVSELNHRVVVSAPQMASDLLATRFVTDSEGGGRHHSNGGSSSKFQQMKRHSLKKLASWKSQLSSLAGSRSERGRHRGHTDYGAVSTAPDGHQVTTGGDAQPGLPPFYLLKYYFRSYTSSLLFSALNSQEKLILSVTYCRRRHSAYPSF